MSKELSSKVNDWEWILETGNGSECKYPFQASERTDWIGNVEWWKL